MPEAPVTAKIYSGRYVHKVDNKRRLPVPFRWRPDEANSEMEFTLIAWSKHEAGVCVKVLPPDKFAKLLADIDAMPNDSANKTLLKRTIGTDSVQAKLDSVGRITIPDEMAEAAGITKEAVLVGNLDRFEIWSPERYEQVRALDKARLGKALEVVE